jgi:hypothetical protein
MTACTTCGNVYDKCFAVSVGNRTFMFDCFECAIHALAPTCQGCGCRVIGHGTEGNGWIYCSAHCAGKVGVTEVQDRA